MKRNVGKADRTNRMAMILLLALAAFFTDGWLRYIFGAFVVYELYTVLFSHCVVYQMMGLSSVEKGEATPSA